MQHILNEKEYQEFLKLRKDFKLEVKRVLVKETSSDKKELILLRDSHTLLSRDRDRVNNSNKEFINQTVSLGHSIVRKN